MVVILDYYENFADNISAIAYAKLIKQNVNAKVYYKNITSKRHLFEKFMSDFDVDINYLSPNNIDEITKKSFLFTKSIIKEKHVKKALSKKTKNKNILLKYSKFKIDDIEKIDLDLKQKFQFRNTLFIQNYDLLEKIQKSQSIGIYISQKDLNNNLINFDYINQALKRLNKYIIKPKLFIFCHDISIKDKLSNDIPFEIINYVNWREQFYFHKECKHKIILDTKDSYSQNLWTSILSENSWGLTIFSKQHKLKKKPNNWIAV